MVKVHAVLELVGQRSQILNVAPQLLPLRRSCRIDRDTRPLPNSSPNPNHNFEMGQRFLADKLTSWLISGSICQRMRVISIHLDSGLARDHCSSVGTTGASSVSFSLLRSGTYAWEEACVGQLAHAIAAWMAARLIHAGGTTDLERLAVDASRPSAPAAAAAAPTPPDCCAWLVLPCRLSLSVCAPAR